MEAQIIKWIQSFSHPILDDVFQVVTMLGRAFYHRRDGAYLLYLIKRWANIYAIAFVSPLRQRHHQVVGSSASSYWRGGDLQSTVETATVIPSPSGHTQSSSTFFFFLLPAG